MFRPSIIAAVCLMLASSQLAHGTSDQNTGEYSLGEITVEAAKDNGELTPLRSLLESGRPAGVGEIVTELPGVSAVRRAASATEPVIRGLGWERVTTQVDGLPLYGACPARMDPPVTYVRSYAPEEIEVLMGLVSVTHGPAGSGGRILVKTDYERSPEDPDEFGGWVKLAGETNREGGTGELGVAGGNALIDFKAAVEALSYSDYETGDGVTIPANQEEFSGALSFGLRPKKNHRWSNYLNYIREEDVDYPALPMNMDETDFFVYTTGYRLRPENGALDEVTVSLGLQNIDHTMSNQDKPNRKILRASTPSESDSYSASVKTISSIGEDDELQVGFDYYHLNRDATRTREIVATGMTAKDRIWPDVSQQDVGGFAEMTKILTDTLNLRLGGRVDFVASSADAADAASLEKKTVRQQFVRFYGEEAGDVDEDEILGTGNIVLTRQSSDWLQTYFGAGIVSRPASVTERFFAFAPAPGGFLVGNPTLDSEQKIELELGARVQKKWLAAEFSFFHNWVNDYILQTLVDRYDVNGDGIVDNVKGFENVDARLYGFEASLNVLAGENWSFPLNLSYVRGKNTSDDQDLPEIPPLELRAAIRYQAGMDLPWWVQFGGRFVASQENVDETFPEDETPGFAVFHLRAGCTLAESWKVELGVENLFDAAYNEHLTREAFFSEGELLAGDEIGAPGISFYASLRWDF